MKRRDLAALRWLEIAIRRAGRRAIRRSLRYGQHEVSTDPQDPVFSDRAMPGELEADMALDVRQALDRLPGEERQVLLLGEVAGMTQRQIATALHCSQARVSRLRRRALAQMRDLLAEGKEPDG